MAILLPGGAGFIGSHTAVELLNKGREITIEEIAKKLDVEVGEVAMCLDAIQTPVSLQEPVYGDGSESIFFMDQVKDKKIMTNFGQKI